MHDEIVIRREPKKPNDPYEWPATTAVDRATHEKLLALMDKSGRTKSYVMRQLIEGAFANLPIRVVDHDEG